MGHIDDPQDQIDSQYPIEEGSILTPLLAFIAPFIGLQPEAAAIAAVIGATGVVADFLSRRRAEERTNVLFRSMQEELRQSSVTRSKVEAEMSKDVAQEAVITATLQTLRTPSYEKIWRFGKVVGSALRAEAPDWERATEFVRDLEQLNDRDLEAMGLLWSVQHPHEAAPGRMHTDANRYTGEWNRVIGAAAERFKWHTDELYSRCGRLTGFGLALEVQPNGSFQGPGDHCFRLTGKGVQLLRILGASPEGLPPPQCQMFFFGTKS
jgi:hypothetical protein